MLTGFNKNIKDKIWKNDMFLAFIFLHEFSLVLQMSNQG